jgi:DNA-binding NarL/FixJ family response regulator
MEINICLFEDSAKVTESIVTLVSLVEGINIVDTFANANDVVRKINASKANLVIMDIDMPGTDGISAVKLIRKAGINISIVMFTVFEDDDKIFEAICAGANGYLLKNSEPSKILEAIKEVMDGGAPMNPSIAKKVLQKFASTNKVSSNDYDLTAREKEILKHLTNGLSYKMIASECHISFETVRTHIKNIYSKLHVASMTEAVAKAINEKIV